MAVKRALQNPRHYINEQFVEIALSKFAIEAFLSPSTLWVWDLAWAITKEDLIQYFSKFGKVYRAMHIYNPITGIQFMVTQIHNISDHLLSQVIRRDMGLLISLIKLICLKPVVVQIELRIST